MGRAGDPVARASSPSEFIETPWFAEEWTRGCSFAHLRPGFLSRYGHLLREVHVLDFDSACCGYRIALDPRHG